MVVTSELNAKIQQLASRACRMLHLLGIKHVCDMANGEVFQEEKTSQ